MDKPTQIIPKQHAMYFGVYLGIYMILKFILFPLALVVPFLSFFYVALTIGLPFVTYFYTRMYRNRVCDGVITFGKAFFFTVQIYFYGALLVSVAHFVYFQFIDNGFLVENMLNIFDQVLEASADSDNYEALEQSINTATDTLAKMTPTSMTFDFLFTNIKLGFILALPTALVLRRSTKKEIK